MTDLTIKPKLTPETQLEFRITNNPTLERNGTLVDPDYGMEGGGRKYMTLDPVEAEIINEYLY